MIAPVFTKNTQVSLVQKAELIGVFFNIIIISISVIVALGA